MTGQVTTDVGRLQGMVDGDVVRFRGVPFADPPVGERRWAPPVPVRAWAGVRDATRPGSPCPQPAVDQPEPQLDEDCLSLEVTAPAAPAPAGRHRPVMVWLHGGSGYGTASTYDAHRLAVQGDVVVVSPNFRFGWMSQLALPGMAPDASQYGFADQQEALRFVKRNAAAFGGDPDNVTLFGESGGAVSACVQLTSPAARGLFDKIVLMSPVGLCSDPVAPDFGGPGTIPITGQRAFRPRPAQEADGLAAAARWGCTDPATVLDCARRVPVATIMKEPPLGTAAAVAPGSLVPRAPMDAITAGEINPVPVLLGGNRAETLLLLSLTLTAGVPDLTANTYAATLRAAYPNRAEQVLAAYPAARYPSPNQAWIAQSTDRAWSCPTAALNDVLAAHTRVFGYEFADPTAPLITATPAPGVPATGPGHAAELAYLFDLRTDPNQASAQTVLDDTQQRLAGNMITVWAAFARTGDPGIPAWSPAQHTVHAFGGNQPHIDLRAVHNCTFWAPDINADLTLSR